MNKSFAFCAKLFSSFARRVLGALVVGKTFGHFWRIPAALVKTVLLVFGRQKRDTWNIALGMFVLLILIVLNTLL